MAHTDHHVPARLFSRFNPTTVYGPLRTVRCMSSHRAKCELAKDVRAASRRARRTARHDLRRGVEPLPYRPRHRVQWDAM